MKKMRCFLPANRLARTIYAKIINGVRFIVVLIPFLIRGFFLETLKCLTDVGLKLFRRKVLKIFCSSQNKVLQKIIEKKDKSEAQRTLILVLLSYAATKGNKEVKMAQMIIDNNLAPAKIDFPSIWWDLRNFVARYLYMYGYANEFLTEFKQLDNIKNNKPFTDLLYL